MLELAHLGRQATGAQACFIVCHHPITGGEAWAAPPSFLSRGSLGEFADRIMASCPNGFDGPVRWWPDSVGAGPLAGRLMADDRLQAAAIRTDSSITAVVLAWTGLARASDPLMDLVLQCAAEALGAERATEAARFWRERADRLAGELATAHAAQERERAHTTLVSELEGRARILAERGRLRQLAGLIGGCLPFDAALIVRRNGGRLRVVAGTMEENWPMLDETSVVASCVRQARTTLRRLNGRSGADPLERLLSRRGAVACLYFPFAEGCWILASSDSIPAHWDNAPALRAVRAATPELERRELRALIASQRTTIARLALRLFQATDAERERIRRDLHDHNAQILAAAQMALRTSPDVARKFFRRLQTDLRGRLQALGTETPRRSLQDMLEQERRRLRAFGISPTIKALGVVGLPREIQQVCGQVVREALSNVVRHSSADRVRIELRRQGGYTKVLVSDNGSSAGRVDSGAGLRGMGERLRLLGGALEVAASADGTRLTARIPEPGR